MKKIQNKIACKECGIILNKPKVDYKHQFNCPRCDACVYRFGQDYQTIILLAITSLILFFPSIFFIHFLITFYDNYISFLTLFLIIIIIAARSEQEYAAYPYYEDQAF